jgi:hypothetical protein
MHNIDEKNKEEGMSSALKVSQFLLNNRSIAASPFLLNFCEKFNQKT